MDTVTTAETLADDMTVREAASTLGKEIAKDFVQSTAVSAGVLAGFVVVGLAYSKLSSIRTARRAKKAEPVVETTESTETPEV